MCKSKCCPVWIIVMIVLAVAAVAAIAFLVIKKLQMLQEGIIVPADEVTTTDAADLIVSDEVPNATDKDFV